LFLYGISAMAFSFSVADCPKAKRQKNDDSRQNITYYCFNNNSSKMEPKASLSDFG
jgi:hypothetical protein